jgi:hypothetical protein
MNKFVVCFFREHSNLPIVYPVPPNKNSKGEVDENTIECPCLDYAVGIDDP